MINIDFLSQITRFDKDNKPHIFLNNEMCKSCEDRACIRACPAKCYVWSENAQRLDVAYENCLECGTCMVICNKKAVEWSYPRGGFGVFYRMT